MSIYADLGVPELWCYEDDVLTVYQLEAGGYHQRDASPAFPFLPLDGVQDFLDRATTMDETSLIRSFRAWIRTLGGIPKGSRQ